MPTTQRLDQVRLTITKELARKLCYADRYSFNTRDETEVNTEQNWPFRLVCISDKPLVTVTTAIDGHQQDKRMKHRRSFVVLFNNQKNSYDQPVV